jgi:hypothetical protein
MNRLHIIFLRIRNFLFGKPIVRELESPNNGLPGPVDDDSGRGTPNNWCLVGNIVEAHNFGVEKKVLHGAKQFLPGTKVYCLPAQWGDGYEKAIVVGLARKSRRWITVVMNTDQITNWRAKVVYQQAVLRRLRTGFEGFRQQWKSQQEVEGWAKWLREREIETAAEKMRN